MTAWWWLAAVVSIAWVILVVVIARTIRGETFDARMKFARVIDRLLDSSHRVESVLQGVHEIARKFLDAKDRAKPKRVQWHCPCCTYSFSVAEHTDAELVVFEWSKGKNTQWAVFAVSGGVKEEVHRIGENGCADSRWDRSVEPPADDVGDIGPDARLLQVFEALGFRPHQPTWSYALWTIRSAAMWIAQKNSEQDDA